MYMYVFLPCKLFSASQTSCNRLLKVLIAVALCEVGLQDDTSSNLSKFVSFLYTVICSWVQKRQDMSQKNITSLTFFFLCFPSCLVLLISIVLHQLCLLQQVRDKNHNEYFVKSIFVPFYSVTIIHFALIKTIILWSNNANFVISYKY